MKLKATVMLNHDGQLHVLTPDDDVPEWAVPLINPRRFVTQPKPEPAEVKPAHRAAAKKTAVRHEPTGS